MPHSVPDSPDRELKIVIVGAGLCGLATAIASALGGHSVQVLERTAELAEIGAGLQLTPNATRLLERWDVLSKISSALAEPTSLTVHRYADGSILADDQQFHRNIRKRYNAPFLDVHRADLQQALFTRARELGVDIRLGARVVSLDNDRNLVVLHDNTTVYGDLIVAADGLWSKCRESLLGKADPPLPTGDLAYRIVLSVDQIVDPELLRIVREPQVHFWIGPEAHVVSYSMRRGTMYNIVLLVPDDLPSDVARQSGSVDEMRQLFMGWDPVLTRFLDCVDSVDKWRLMYREPLDSWASAKGNIVMTGDCCHPMLPYLAQGANSSIEDGAVLGNLLSAVTHSVQLPAVIEKFQQLRKPRGEAIVRETFRQRDDFHMRDGPQQQQRDQKFKDSLGQEIVGAFPSRWTCPVVQKWLYGYDAYYESDRAANEIAKITVDFH